ncbi:MAG TPA: hypothetical protein DEF18_01360 [Muricauda sp.]|nr:hypothetical protein [Allomuricauda sp.]
MFNCLVSNGNVLSLFTVYRIQNIVISLLFFILSIVALAQERAAKGTEGLHLLENIHLQLNKTAFLKGEHIWFKAYVQNQNQHLPSLATKNLHVGIFSKDGSMLTKKMVLIRNGVSFGDFKVDSTFVEDSYTIMAWTNYMKNFEFTTPFLQNIEIIGVAEQSESKNKGGITVLVYPEGQQIVANTYNNVGFKIFNQTLQPIKTNEIELITGKGERIQSNIQTNQLGQGRFGFFADPTETYFLKLKTPNGLWVTKELEDKQHHGIGISIDNTAQDVVVLNSKRSKSILNNEKFSMAIYNHVNGNYVYRYELDGDSGPTSVNRNQIPGGINTAVILDETMKPISQRMFFNRQNLKERVGSVDVSYCLNKAQDSLQIDMILPQGHQMANLSLSVLPAESSAYFPDNSIASSFLIQPYLHKHIEGRYFFDGNKRSRDYQMDTRLLMEGAERFDQYITAGYAQSNTYKHEEEITFNGKILDADLENEKQVSLFSQALGTVNFFELSTNKNFEGNLPLFEGDSILISVLNHKGKLRKPKAELYFDDNNADTFEYTKWLSKAGRFKSGVSQLRMNESFNLTDGIISLDEVVVSERAKETTKFQITPEIQMRIIDKTTVKRYPSFISYIRKFGFQTHPNSKGGVGVYVPDPPYLARVPVLIEGLPVDSGQLMSMPLSMVKSMVYNRYVTPHQGPFISLSLRYDYDGLYGRDKFTSITVPKGFSRAQAYFTPNYPDYGSLLYQRYGAIWWESQFEVNSDVPYSITVPLNEQREVKIIIEGMSSNGFLYYTEQICSPFEANYTSKQQE